VRHFRVRADLTTYRRQAEPVFVDRELRKWSVGIARRFLGDDCETARGQSTDRRDTIGGENVVRYGVDHNLSHYLHYEYALAVRLLIDTE
jgi:hypothetical protein